MLLPSYYYLGSPRYHRGKELWELHVVDSHVMPQKRILKSCPPQSLASLRALTYNNIY